MEHTNVFITSFFFFLRHLDTGSPCTFKWIFYIPTKNSYCFLLTLYCIQSFILNNVTFFSIIIKYVHKELGEKRLASLTQSKT